MIEFTKQDCILLAEALDRAATRQMSESRRSPHAETAKYHKDKALAMQKLKSKVLEVGAEIGQ